ncbi:UNVERIFIED_CONTAM: hypothetical protein K2H54_003111 [Gekko kuhli]
MDFHLSLVLKAWLPGTADCVEHVPAELHEAFYTDQYEQEHVKPPLIRLLLSSDIYCRAWRQALPPGPDVASAPKDNAALLQLLARRGLVPTFQDKPIKEVDLHHKPIRLGPSATAALAPLQSGAVVADGWEARGCSPHPVKTGGVAGHAAVHITSSGGVGGAGPPPRTRDVGCSAAGRNPPRISGVIPLETGRVKERPEAVHWTSRDL